MKKESVTLKTLKKIVQSLKKNVEGFLSFKLDISRLTEFFSGSLYEVKFTDGTIVLVICRNTGEARKSVATRFGKRTIENVRKVK